MKRIRESIEHHYHRLSAIAIFAAFIIDSVTLVRVDLYLTNLLLIVYLAIVGGGILIINLYEEGRARFISADAYWWIFIATQFSFGGLFGRFLIYYSRSGSIYNSWPFLLILAGLLIGNELGRKYYDRLVLQISFFFLALFSFLIFFVPVLLGRMSDSIFFLSGLISLSLISLFIWILSRLVPARIKNSGYALFGSIVSIFILINWLYSTNIIPPIPLSLHEAGVYHSVSRTSDGYLVMGEKASPFSFLMPYKTIHMSLGNPLYVYSAVFAPTNFETSVVHDWQNYNPFTEVWESRSRVVLPVVGGRDYGYRGYSIKNNLNPGLWRVNIETLRGQVVGRLKFKIEKADKEPVLISEVL